MLTLTRKLTQALVIGENVTITVLEIKGSRVRLGVNAPADVPVKRLEALQKAAAGQSVAAPAP